MSYNTDFLIAAMIIQLIILCHFSAQKRPDDLNNQLFLILSVLVSLDIAFEVLSTCYINFEHAGTRLGAINVYNNGLLPVPGPAALRPDLLCPFSPGK